MLALVGAALVASVVAFGLTRSLDAGARRRVGRGLIALAVVVVAGAAAAASVSAADALSSSRDCSEVVNDPSRLGSLDPNLRLCWWEEALDVYAHHGPEGAGAGTFEVARKRFRLDARNVVQPHSVPLQHLADGGVVGLGLFVALVLAAAAACVCALRRLDGRGTGRGSGARRAAGRVPRARARRLQLGLPRGDRADDGRARRPRRRGQELAARAAPAVPRRRA